MREALRGTLARKGVAVSLIVPGFVHTALNEKLVAPKPLAMTDDRAARIIRRGLDRPGGDRLPEAALLGRAAGDGPAGSPRRFLHDAPARRRACHARKDAHVSAALDILRWPAASLSAWRCL